MDFSYIDKNVASARDQIRRAAGKVGRSQEDILLLAAVKSATAEEIDHIHKSLGICDIGENRVQQLLEHWDKIDREELRVHFIGSLQTNKVKYIIDKVTLIHSLDSERLAKEIQRQAQKHGLVVNVLIEINSGSEESKGGIDPQDVADFAQSLEEYPNLNLLGFMTMAPRCEDKNHYYEYFGKTRDIAAHVWSEILKKEGAPILSMGMSESFTQAIECGSTLVRIGRSLFSKS